MARLPQRCQLVVDNVVDNGAGAQLTIDFVTTVMTRFERGVIVCAMASALAFGAATATAAARQDAAKPAAVERVRVPAGHANVHMGPNTTTEVLVLVARDTVLTVLARDKEWIQVRLTPDLRKSGMVMRWYKNEDRGWMHDSTVQAVK